VNLYNAPAGTIRASRRRRLRYAQDDPDRTSAVTPRLLSTHSPARAPESQRCAQAARTAKSAQLPMPRWLADRPRVTGLTLVAAGWAATVAAVMVGSQLGRGAAALVIFAATMSTAALGQTLLSPARPVIIDDQAPSGVSGRYHRPGTLALVTGCILGPLVGGAALGADWATTLLTTLAVTCAVVGIAARRLGRQLVPGAGRIPWRARPLRTTRQAGQRGARCRSSRRPIMCSHEPQCPSAGDTARAAAQVMAGHPEQGSSLLCNGIVLFDDGGLLLPDGRAQAPPTRPFPAMAA
jgi:hypothetical protein